MIMLMLLLCGLSISLNEMLDDARDKHQDNYVMSIGLPVIQIIMDLSVALIGLALTLEYLIGIVNK